MDHLGETQNNLMSDNEHHHHLANSGYTLGNVKVSSSRDKYIESASTGSSTKNRVVRSAMVFFLNFWRAVLVNFCCLNKKYRDSHQT